MDDEEFETWPRREPEPDTVLSQLLPSRYLGSVSERFDEGLNKVPLPHIAFFFK
jgi:hypothetical protein